MKPVMSGEFGSETELPSVTVVPSALWPELGMPVIDAVGGPLSTTMVMLATGLVSPSWSLAVRVIW